MRNIFKATLIVTIFSVLTRGLGFILRIILSRNLGAEMLGSYQISMSILGVLMTIIASGIPLVISRTVAYNKSINQENSAYSTTTAGLVITLTISCLITLLLYLFPDLLNFLSGNNYTKNIILLALPSLIFSAIYCVLRSALWGDKHFFAISFTEFFEQVVRIICCFILFTLPIFPNLSMGEKASLSLTFACLLSAILVIAVYFSLKQKISSPKGAIKPLLKSSSSITALRTVSSIVSSLISIIIPVRLMKYGFSSSEAIAQYGMIMGMAFPLIMIPSTLIGSVAVTLIPEISSKTDNIDDASKTHNLGGLKNNILTGINVSILISMIFVPSFIVLGEPICNILYGSSTAGKYVSVGAILMLPVGINQITSSILNSIGLEFKSLINYVFGAAALILSILFLPKYIGTYALIVGYSFMSIISAILNLRMLKKRNLLKKGYFKFIIQSIFFAMFSVLIGKFTYNIISLFLSEFLSTLLCGILTTACMVSLYLCFKVSDIKGFVVKRLKRKQ